MSWGIIELELNVLSRIVKSANWHNNSFPHKKIVSISLIMLYMLQVYDTKWANTYCVVSLFIILLGTYFYVQWILKIVLITSPWNIQNGMIIFLAFGYCIFFVICVYVCVYPSHVCFKLMKNGKNIRWIVRNDMKESNGKTIQLMGCWRLLHVCNRVICYYVP
jgi:hypothetical protein